MKRIIFLVALLVVGIQSVVAADFSSVSPSGHTLYYNINNATAHTLTVTYPAANWTGYTKPTGNLTIPSSVSYGGITYTVTEIGNSAFKFCGSLITVIMPNTITKIQTLAFAYCSSLSSISFPQSLDTINNEAFKYCSNLTSIVTPESIRYIGDEAFQYCSNLSFAIIGVECRYIGHYAFANTASTRIIRFHNSHPYNNYTINTTGGYTMNVGCFRTVSEMSSIYLRYEVPCGSYGHYFSYLVTMGSCYTPSAISEIPPYEFDVTSSDTIMGNVEITLRPRCTGGIPCENTTVSNLNAAFSAVPNYGFHFVEWSDGDTSIHRNFSISSDTFFIAFFAPDTFLINTTSNNASFGQVQGGGYYPYNSIATIEAVSAEHYHFLRWSDGNINNPRQINVLSDTTIVAYFAIDTHHVSVESNNISFGNVAGGGDYIYGTPATLSATAYSGYRFINWSNGNTLNPYTFAVVEDISLTAIFGEEVPIYYVTVTSANSTMGTVTGGGSYEEGTIAQLTAVPYNGYQFDHWSDGNTQNPRTITVNSNITLMAYFVQNSQYYTVTLFVNDYSKGSVTGGGSYEQGSTATCEAIPYSGNYFERWSDNNTQNPRLITVNSDITLTAYFAANAGIDDIDDYGIIMYAKDYQILIDEAIGKEITVYTIDGRSIASMLIATDHVAIPVTNKGVYIVKIGNHPARKVVVIR